MPARARLMFAVAATGLGLAGWTGGLAPAAADPVIDPVLPVDPAVPPQAPAAAAQSMLGQAVATLGQSNPLTAMTDFLANSPQPALLGQAPLPPETVSSGPAPDPMTLAQMLMPQNYRMPTPDQASPYALAPNTAPSPFARIDAWKGVHALVHGSLGRMPGDELGQPLPGTAPPPGSNIPPGLEQFYVDPAAAPPATAPAGPLLPPVAPPG